MDRENHSMTPAAAPPREGHAKRAWTYEVRELSDGPEGIVYDKHGRVVAQHLSEDETSLIAAAPALLEALGPLLEAYIEAVQSNAASRRDPERDAEVIAARAALRQAGA